MALERLQEISDANTHLYGVRHWDIKLSESRSEIRAQRDCEYCGEESGDQVDGTLSADPSNATPTIEGFGAVFDSNSLPIMGMFTERIQRGAFRRVLAANPDIRLLANHEDLPYARTANGSMLVQERPEGLYFRAQLIPGTRSSDLYELVQSGTVDQCSFAFRVAMNGDSWACDCGDPLGPECMCTPQQVVRTIIEVSECPEISVVTFPAYPSTSVQVAREGGPIGERNAQGSDEQQRVVAPVGDASMPAHVSDPRERAYRARIIRLKGHHNERIDRGARGRA